MPRNSSFPTFQSHCPKPHPRRPRVLQIFLLHLKEKLARRVDLRESPDLQLIRRTWCHSGRCTAFASQHDHRQRGVRRAAAPLASDRSTYPVRPRRETDRISAQAARICRRGVHSNGGYIQIEVVIHSVDSSSCGFHHCDVHTSCGRRTRGKGDNVVDGAWLDHHQLNDVRRACVRVLHLNVQISGLCYVCAGYRRDANSRACAIGNARSSADQ